MFYELVMIRLMVFEIIVGDITGNVRSTGNSMFRMWWKLSKFQNNTYLGGDCDVMEFCLSSCRNFAIADMGFAGPTVLVVTEGGEI